MFFSRITADHWTAKNKLEAEAKKVAKEMERQIITDEDLRRFKNAFKDKIAELNATHSRCKPLELNFWHPTKDVETYIEISSVFQMELIHVKGTYNKVQ